MIRRARAGESVAVTSHCMPVGRLLPRTPTSGGSLPERLLAAGAISELPRRGGLGPRQPGPLLAGDAGTLSDAACDDRR